MSPAKDNSTAVNLCTKLNVEPEHGDLQQEETCIILYYKRRWQKITKIELQMSYTRTVSFSLLKLLVSTYTNITGFPQKTSVKDDVL